MSARRPLTGLAVAAACLLAAVAAAPRAADTGDWPATPAAEQARGWVDAFNRGEPAMRAWLTAHMAPEELAMRGVDARLETYRGNLERFGSLMLVSVDSSGTTGIRVTLAAADLSLQKFGFYTQPRPPYRLLRVLRTETRHVHGGAGH